MFSYATPGVKAATACNPTGRRGTARLRVSIPARLILRGGSCACALESISQTGARVVCKTAVDIGATGVLQCMELDILCSVVRVEGGYIGLQFDEDVDAQALQKIRQQHDILINTRICNNRLHAKRWATGVDS
ncbi:PilZ domain-containing protein [Allopontixanthobacter sp.]|uniref:PilZ domain-containing protein n=1 Tax=Allopontixanthobacter sp. TaxID=2906452 RepID=UPI003A103AC6